MACERCGAPAQGRLCSVCEADDRMDEIATDLTEQFDEEDSDNE